MTESLSDLFAAEQSPMVEWEGGLAYAIYELEPVPDTVTVEFVAAKSSPVQGLRLKIRGGFLIANDLRTNDLLLWHDTAPERVIVRVEARPGRQVSLRAWNVWRGGLEVVQAWQGNSGMRVEVSREGRQIGLRCSDGVGPVEFGDLEVNLIVD